MMVELSEGRILHPYSQTQVSGKFELAPFKYKRTAGQNKYWHGYLFPEAARAMSHKIGKPISMALAKEVLISRCGVFYVQAIDEYIAFRTSKMNTSQAVTFTERALKYIAEKTGEYLEEPNEEQWRQIKEEK